MIGIIAAMDVEIDKLKKLMEDIEIIKISRINFYCGKLGGKDVVAATCGVGKVNASICAQTMILKYSPDYIINTGVGGSLTKSLKVLDIVIAKDVLQHDFDITALGEERGLLPILNKVKIPCDELLIGKFKEVARELPNINFKEGTVATGDQFISSKEKNEWIRNKFSAIACEMEGGAIGQVCAINNTKFCIIRSISDSGDENAIMDFGTFVKEAADNSIQLLIKVLQKI